MTRIIPCPRCGKEVPWQAESRYRPFCSRRCQLIDFGEWASERKRLPGDAEYDDFTEEDTGRSKPHAVD